MIQNKTYYFHKFEKVIRTSQVLWIINNNDV